MKKYDSVLWDIKTVIHCDLKNAYFFFGGLLHEDSIMISELAVTVKQFFMQKN